MRRWIPAALLAVLLHGWFLTRSHRRPAEAPELPSPRPELVTVDLEVPAKPGPASPMIHSPAPAPRAPSHVAAVARPESTSPVVVAVEDAEGPEGDEPADGAGAGRYYDLWKVDTLPVPERSSSTPPLDAGTDFLLSVTVTGGGRVAGVVAGDAQLPEVPPEVRRALRRQRFVAAKGDGMAVSTTFPVYFRLVRDADGGVTDWQVSNPGWILRR